MASEVDPLAEFGAKPPVAVEDPLAEFGAKPPPAPAVAPEAVPEVGLGESAIQQLAQKTIPLTDEIGGVVGAGVHLLNPKSPYSGVMDAYRQTRDYGRNREKLSEKQHPTLSKATTAGSLVLGLGMPMGGATKALGEGKAALEAARKLNLLKGAGIGGAYGLAASDADLTRGDVVGAAKDTATGAVIGLGTAFGVDKLANSRAGQWVGEKVQGGLEAVRERGQIAGRYDALRGLVDKFKGLQKQRREASAMKRSTKAGEVLEEGKALRDTFVREPQTNRLSSPVAKQQAASEVEAQIAAARGALGPDRAYFSRAADVLEKRGPQSTNAAEAQEVLSDPELLRQLDSIVGNYADKVPGRIEGFKAKQESLDGLLRRKDSLIDSRERDLAMELYDKANGMISKGREGLNFETARREATAAKEQLKQIEEPGLVSGVAEKLLGHVMPDSFAKTAVNTVKRPLMRAEGWVADKMLGNNVSPNNFVQGFNSLSGHTANAPMSVQALQKIASETPQDFGKSAPAMQKAAEQGKQATSAEFFRQQQVNPELAADSDDDYALE